MSEDLKFDDIFNAVSIFLKENFTFRKCDLLIFRGAGDDMAVDREYTLWYGRESGASAGRIDYDKLATMFMAGFRDVYLTRSENQQTFADLRVEDPAVESLLAVPLLSEKRMVGMFVAQNLPKADVERFVILSTQFALELKKVLLYEMVERMAITDSLTGLYVRRHFSERLEEELQRSARFGFRLAFLMLDIDDFKKTNDTYGHLVGDAVLKDMARLIKESVREIDIVARYGGEEISLMLPETSRASAMTVAERLRRKIEGYEFKAYDERVRVTVSIGVSVYPDDAQDQRELVDKADEALYTAKNSGKNVVCEWRKRYNIENHKL
jgi:diguanylate cyclase (GGDEF)-like protein